MARRSIRSMLGGSCGPLDRDRVSLLDGPVQTLYLPLTASDSLRLSFFFLLFFPLPFREDGGRCPGQGLRRLWGAGRVQ